MDREGLAHFLRRRRAERHPEDVGLDARRRSRVALVPLPLPADRSAA